jgi:hypothetical protein
MGVSDKTMHFAAYAMLSFLLWFCIYFDHKADWRKISTWLVFGAAIMYGAADEITQKFIAGRSADIVDFYADLTGIAVAILTVSILPGRFAVVVPIMLCPVFLPGMVRAGLLAQGTILEWGGYFLCFATISFLLAFFLKNRVAVFMLAVADVILLKLYAVITNKLMGTQTIVSALAAVVLVSVALFYFWPVKRVAEQD